MSRLLVLDLQGEVSIDSEDALLERLRTVRKGKYGAFILSHDDIGPELWVHISDRFAYVHFFDDHTGDNAGYQPTGMTPPGCPKSVLFVQTDGSEGTGSAIQMPHYTIVSVDVAYQAALEFFGETVKPHCITWTAL